jgi:hypothetical protein
VTARAGPRTQWRREGVRPGGRRVSGGACEGEGRGRSRGGAEHLHEPARGLGAAGPHAGRGAADVVQHEVVQPT